MKKILEYIKNILMMIVYPSRILELFKVKNLDQNYNKLLGNDHVVKVLALILTLILVVAARYTPDAVTTGEHQVILRDIIVDILIDEENYTYFGNIPSHVDVILTGDRTLIDILMFSSGSITANIDLRSLELGFHDHVLIRVEGAEHEQITATPSISIIPGGVDIVQIETWELPIETDNMLVTGLPEINTRYGMETTSVTPEYVTVRGPRMFLDEIAAIRVTFDASDMTGEPDEFNFEGIVVAHDSTAAPVSGIEIYPPLVDVQVKIYENLRIIDIVVNDQLPLNMPSGYSVLDMTADVDEIQVWGDFTEMDGTIELPRINFADLDEDGRITVQIQPLLPINVKSEPTEVVITIDYEEAPWQLD